MAEEKATSSKEEINAVPDDEDLANSLATPGTGDIDPAMAEIINQALLAAAQVHAAQLDALTEIFLGSPRMPLAELSQANAYIRRYMRAAKILQASGVWKGTNEPRKSISEEDNSAIIASCVEEVEQKREMMQGDQEEIDRLKSETRALMTKLRVA